MNSPTWSAPAPSVLRVHIIVRNNVCNVSVVYVNYVCPTPRAGIANGRKLKVVYQDLYNGITLMKIDYFFFVCVCEIPIIIFALECMKCERNQEVS
jgi:hypothetical protein